MGGELHVAVTHREGALSLDVKLVAKPGITVLFGPSGAGKSTLLSVIAGVVRPHAGTVRLGDEVLLDTGRGVEVAPHLRRVAMVFQSPALFPHMTALANVTYGMVPRGAASAMRERARELLRAWDIETLAERKPARFSGGEAQRVALARAFAMAPLAMLLDEPFSALDGARRRTLAKKLTLEIKERAIPALFVTHSLSEARAVGDHVVVLEEGRVTRQGAPSDVLADQPD